MYSLHAVRTRSAHLHLDFFAVLRRMSASSAGILIPNGSIARRMPERSVGVVFAFVFIWLTIWCVREYFGFSLTSFGFFCYDVIVLFSITVDSIPPFGLFCQHQMERKMKKVLERIISLKDADSTAEFARTVGLHPQTVDNYLSEKRKISLEFIIRVCQNCNVSADWVLGFSSDRRGTSAPPSSLELQTLVSELQAENARLNAELVRVNGENVGLRYAVEALGKSK